MQRVLRLFNALIFASLIIAPLHAQAPATQAAQTASRGQPDFERWEDAIARIERSGDREPGGIVFIGSSSIARWTTLAADFPDLPVRNHGFGGSIVAEVTHFADRLVLPYRPRLVLLYAGDNDLGTGRTPEQVLTDFQGFVGKVRGALPQTRIAFISIKPSILRAHLFAQMGEANALVREWLGTQANTDYIDVFTPMLDTEGNIRADLFVADNLHLNSTGYEIWTRVIGPYLE